MSLIEELKRRNVFRVALAYGVLGWLVLQVADVLVDALELPVVWSKAVIALLMVGFIPTLVFSWVYELTPEGLKKESEIDHEHSVTGHTAKKLNHAIIFLLVVAIGLFTWDRFFVKSAGEFTVPPGSAAAPVATSSEGRPSVAVLAFENMSADADNEYFADGISEEILNLLADVRDLSVASRTSAFAFKGSNLPIPEIASALKVRYVLEGSVRKAGDQVRVTAQLIDAQTDRHLWSETFDRALRDVFTIQDEVALAIGDALQVELLGEGGVEVRSESINPDVYNQFLEARYLMRRRADEDVREGNHLLIDVVTAEPRFARAHVLLGEAYLLNNLLLDSVGRELVEKLANMHASLARDIDPSLGGIEMILGSIEQRKEPLNALRHYDRAIQLEPMEPRPYHWRGLLYTTLGYADRCASDLERALELDPQNPNVHFALSACLQAGADWDRSVEVATHGATLGNPGGYGLAIHARFQQGMVDEALTHLAYMQEAGIRSDDGGLASLEELLTGRLEASALTEEQLEILGPSGLLFLDDPEPLFRVLGESQRGDINFAAMGHFWGASRDRFRSDPRFIDFLEREGVLDVWRELGPPEGCRAVGATFSCAQE